MNGDGGKIVSVAEPVFTAAQEQRILVLIAAAFRAAEIEHHPLRILPLPPLKIVVQPDLPALKSSLGRFEDHLSLTTAARDHA